MSVGSDIWTPLSDAPKARSEKGDKQGAVEFYEKLLGSTCSLIEILDGVHCIQSKSKNRDTVAAAHSHLDRSAVNNANLPRSEVDTPRTADTPASTGSGTASFRGIFAWFLPGRWASLTKEIAFVAFCAIVLALASVEVFSILLAGRNIHPATAGVRSDILGRTGAITAAPVDSSREPIPLVTESPSVSSTESDKVASHSNAGQPNEGKPLEATPTHQATTTASMPTENMPAKLSGPAHAAKSGKSSPPHRYAEARRRVRQQRPAIYAQPAYGERPPRSYYSEFDRGFSYGGPALRSDSGS